MSKIQTREVGTDFGPAERTCRPKFEKIQKAAGADHSGNMVLRAPLTKERKVRANCTHLRGGRDAGVQLGVLPWSGNG